MVYRGKGDTVTQIFLSGKSEVTLLLLPLLDHIPLFPKKDTKLVIFDQVIKLHPHFEILPYLYAMSAAAAAGLRCAKGSSEARSSHRQSPNENTSALIEYLVHWKKMNLIN